MFIIKKHYEATEYNPNFAGEVKDYYEGKAGHILSSNTFPVKWEIENYGYKTLAAAKRGLKKARELADWETAKGFWNVSVELVPC
ncbi:MAG: hypothetical protein IJX67_05985 [Oscillospiraceae bacterium]|nr:hypothetical protein [Oscillospiraceae bacterium]